MATTAADELNALNQLLAQAGLGATQLTVDSSVADYLAALNSVFSMVKLQMDAAVQAAAEGDALLGTNYAAQIQAQENLFITLYQSTLSSLANASPSASLAAALAAAAPAPAPAPAPSPAPAPAPAPLPTTSDIAPLAYSGEGVRIFGDTPMLLRETDYTVPSTATYTRVGTTAAFASPEISSDWMTVGGVRYASVSAAADVAYDAFVNAAKQLVGEAVKDSPWASVAITANDAREVGEAMNGTLNGTLQLMSDLTKVLNGTMTESDWIAKQETWEEQQKAKYDAMAASAVTGKIPVVGWVLSPVVDKLFGVTVTAQVTNSYELRASLETNIPGGPKANVVIGGDQHNTIQLGGGSSAAAGGDAGNVFLVGSGSDLIIGGDGLDEVVLPYVRTDYHVTESADGTLALSVTKSGVTVKDTLFDVERLEFSNGVLALDVGAGEVAGQAYRIYQAAFARTPDISGLEFWIGAMDGGATLGQVAAGFLDSAEFKSIYGSNPSNVDLVTRFYENVLGREPEASGYNFWVSVLDSGNSRSGVLASFAESAENQARVIGAIEDGIWLGT